MYRNFVFPSREELAAHAREMPEIHPDDVITMLTVMKAAEEIKGKPMAFWSGGTTCPRESSVS